jgi:DNA invertase Pin-like site-specific DNA recombinase
VRAGRVDVIVVYKVDRLTRSLADFAKLVELLDRHNVSFVSVTQQFNTTTSMGRLSGASRAGAGNAARRRRLGARARGTEGRDKINRRRPGAAAPPPSEGHYFDGGTLSTSNPILSTLA